MAALSYRAKNHGAISARHTDCLTKRAALRANVTTYTGDYSNSLNELSEDLVRAALQRAIDNGCS